MRISPILFTPSWSDVEENKLILKYSFLGSMLRKIPLNNEIAKEVAVLQPGIIKSFQIEFTAGHLLM